jgi:hypothetical protein
MTSLSGRSRALYLTSYESFDAWQKDTEAVTKNATLSAALERASVADGELLDSLDQGVFYFRDEMSLYPRADLSQMRYMELLLFRVRPTLPYSNCEIYCPVTLTALARCSWP